MFDIGTLVGRITLEDDASASMKTFASNLDKVGSATSAAGRTLTIGITAPLVAAAGASLLLSSNFEASMTRLVSLAGVSSGELANVKQSILDLAPATGIGPQKLAEAMTKVSSTVSDTSVALKILDTSAKLSAAGMGEAVDVAGAITAVVNSYGAENITAARAADILTQAVKDGGAEAKELAPTLANVVPIAAQMGISFEEVGANIATLTKLGVPASEAVTQLSSVMTALLKETKQGGEALGKVGLTYDDLRAAVRDRGLAAAMTDLTQRFGENKTGLTDVFGRIEALKNIMGTAGQQATTYASVLDNMKHSSDGLGKSTEVFNAMQDTQVMTWGKVTAALSVAAIQLGDALAPAMKSVLDVALPLISGISSLAKWFADLPKPVQGTAIAITALVAAAGPALMIIGSIASGISALIPVVTTIGTAIGVTSVASMGAFVVASVPIIAAITAITAVVVIGYQAWQLYKEHQDRARGVVLQAAVDQENLARISKVAGIEFDNLGAALAWVRENHDKLWPVVQTTTEKLKDGAAAAQHTALMTEEYKAALDAVNAVGVGYWQTLATMDSKTIETIKSKLAAGAAEKDLAIVYQLTEAQVKAVSVTTEEYGNRLKAVKEIELGSNAEITNSLGALAAMKRDLTQKGFEAESQGLDKIKMLQAELRDIKMKNELDTTAYQLAKIKERMDAEIAAFGASGAVMASIIQYTELRKALAQSEAEAVIAASNKTKAALIANTWEEYHAMWEALIAKQRLEIQVTGSYTPQDVRLGPALTGRLPVSAAPMPGMRSPGFVDLGPTYIAPGRNYDRGGPVTSDGPIYAHAGEFVMSREMLASGGGGGGQGDTFVFNVIDTVAASRRFEQVIMNKAKNRRKFRST